MIAYSIAISYRAAPVHTGCPGIRLLFLAHIRTGSIHDPVLVALVWDSVPTLAPGGTGANITSALNTDTNMSSNSGDVVYFDGVSGQGYLSPGERSVPHPHRVNLQKSIICLFPPYTLF